MTTKTEKLIRALASGKNVPTTTLRKRTGLANVSATVDRLRQEGFEIYANTKGEKGNKYSAYRMAGLSA